MTELRAAAQAVVDRWDSPLWKDVEPTAHVINRLRDAATGPSARDLISPQMVTAIQDVRGWLDFALRNEWTPESRDAAEKAHDRLDAAIADDAYNAPEPDTAPVVRYEVWHRCELVASCDNLADAARYNAVYGGGDRSEIIVATTTRVPAGTQPGTGVVHTNPPTTGRRE